MGQCNTVKVLLHIFYLERDPGDYIYRYCGKYTIVQDSEESDVEKVIQDLKVMYLWEDISEDRQIA